MTVEDLSVSNLNILVTRMTSGKKFLFFQFLQENLYLSYSLTKIVLAWIG